MTLEPALRLRIHAIRYAAEGVLLFDLRAAEGGVLPTFEPGAHLDLRLPTGPVRSYSLLNDADERHRYLIGVKREENSRGGSAWLHDSARVGGMLDVVPPNNHFSLVEDAPNSVFFAGGIGITPLWCMVQRLRVRGRPWTLHFRSQSRASAALLDRLERPDMAQHCHIGFSDSADIARMDIARIVAEAPAHTHFYCCGPLPMLEAFEAACATLEPSRVHREYFAAREAPALEGGYTVRLARSGLHVPIPSGKTILETLRGSGIAVPSSCEQGICGACETRVLAGIPDHRDLVLSADEKGANDTMMICCSGVRGGEVVLDL
jgi:vanillate O-demethylase ferredoxin subunit